MKAEDQNKMRLSIRVSIRSEQGMGHLEVSEELLLDARNFMDMCRVLGQFQELAEKIRGGNF